MYYYYKQPMENSSIQIDESVTQQGLLSIDSIKLKMQSMYASHQSFIEILKTKEAQITQQQSQFKIKKDKTDTFVQAQISKLKQFYQSFRSQCINSWISVFQQFIDISNQIATVYQLKVEKLQQYILSHEQSLLKISEVERENELLKQMLFKNDRINEIITSNLDINANQKIQNSKIKINEVLKNPTLFSSSSQKSYINSDCELFSSKITEIFDEEQGVTNLEINEISEIFDEGKDNGERDFKYYESQRNMIKSCQVHALQNANVLQNQPQFSFSKTVDFLTKLSADSKPKVYSKFISNSNGKQNKNSKSITEKRRESEGYTKLEQLRKNLFQKKKSIGKVL